MFIVIFFKFSFLMLHCYLLVVFAVFRCLLFCNSRIEFRISLCSNEEYIKGVVIFVMKIKGKKSMKTH